MHWVIKHQIDRQLVHCVAIYPGSTAWICCILGLAPWRADRP